MGTSPLELHMINYLLAKKEDEELNEWESEFIESLSNYPLEHTLSANERLKLKEIYDKY
jgi:hypothetical protein